MPGNEPAKRSHGEARSWSRACLLTTPGPKTTKGPPPPVKETTGQFLNSLAPREENYFFIKTRLAACNRTSAVAADVPIWQVKIAFFVEVVSSAAVP